jgi:hypothetical protein
MTQPHRSLPDGVLQGRQKQLYSSSLQVALAMLLLLLCFPVAYHTSGTLPIGAYCCGMCAVLLLAAASLLQLLHMAAAAEPASCCGILLLCFPSTNAAMLFLQDTYAYHRLAARCCCCCCCCSLLHDLAAVVVRLLAGMPPAHISRQLHAHICRCILLKTTVRQAPSRYCFITHAMRSWHVINMGCSGNVIC